MAAETKDQALDLVAAVFVRAGARLAEVRPTTKKASQGEAFFPERAAA